MTWLFAAYATVWIALFVYIMSLDRRQRAVADEIEDLKAKVN